MNQPTHNNQQVSIALIIPSLTAGGAERVFSILANALAKHYKVTLFILYKCEIFYKLDSQIEVVFCKDYYTPNFNCIKSVINNFSFIKFLKQEIKVRNSQLILGFTTTANVYSVIISRRLRIKSVISERIYPEFGINSFWKRVRQFVYPKTNLLVVQTIPIKTYFNTFVNSDKIQIIENPLSPELISKRKAGNRTNTIISIGRLDQQKNQDLLLKAFSKLDEEKWKLIIIGEGQLRERYEQLAKSLKIEKQVEFTGAIKDVSTYLNTGGIFVLSSRFEGFPNVLIEAMYFGMPCIATDCPSGPSDIIEDGKNGFLIPVEDEDALSKKLDILIDNEALCESFGENAQRTASRFETDLIVDKWLNAINSVITN